MQCSVDIHKNKICDFFDTNDPLVSKTIKIKDSHSLWYNNEIINAKKSMRKAEKKYLRQSKEHNAYELRTEVDRFQCH